MTNSIRILYLDGFEDDRKLIGDVLDSRQAGVEIAEAENSREFEDYLQSGPWDMVLTEIDAAGFKCLEMVDRALQQLPGIPVVVITGSGSEEIAAESTLRGASGYIVKTPENISRLPETLREILERRKSFPNPPDGEDILNKLVRNSVDMLVILDEEGKERFVSDSVERVTGFTIEEVKGGDAFSFLHPGDLERVRKVFDDLVSRKGATTRAEYRHRLKAGGWIHLEAVGTNCLDDPFINGIVLSVRDISQRKEREEGLRKGWKRLDKMLRNSSDLLIILDEKGNELYVSHSSEGITGYTAEEMIGQCCFDYMHPDDVPRLAEVFNRGMNNPGEPQRIELRRKTKDGGWVHLEATGTSYLDDPDISAIVVNARDITSRQRAHESLRERGQIFDKLVRNSSDMLVILDANGREKYISESLERIAGYSPDEVIGTLSFDHFHEDDLDAVYRTRAALMEEPDKVHRVEYRRRKKDGGWVYLEAFCRNLLDDPDIQGIVVNARDITSRKEAEQKLSESKERYRMLASLLPEAVWEADLEGRIRFINHKGLEMTGYTQADVESGINGFDFYAQPGRQKCIERTMEVLRGDKSFITEYEMLRKDGSTFPALVHSELVRIEGEPAYFVGIGIDISERKKSEIEHRHLVAAIEQSHETVVVTDADANIVYVNPSFEIISGYSREEVIGRNPRVLKSGEHSRSFYRSLWKVLDSGKTWQGTFVNKRKNGKLYSEQATISPVFDEDGEIVNYVAVKRDITEELRINREKSELEKQYHQAQKMETVGLLAGGIAHDLNNLLTPILGYSEMIIEDAQASEAGREYARIILKASRGARDIVSRLLAFSRKQALDLKPLDLNRALMEMEEKLIQLLPDDVTFKTDFADGIPEITGDFAQLQQVLTDLVKNAGEAMPGGGDLTIETSLVEFSEHIDASGEALNPGTYVSLSISDTGFGMDAQTRAQVFEPFFTTKPVGTGSGLGLATSYGIIRQHGGDIRVSSQPLKGSTFRILLPVQGTAQRTEDRESEAAGNAEGDEVILIVEDDDYVREMSSAVLKRRGYRVFVAETGEDALEMLAKKDLKVDLLLTDVVMPGISGRELYDLVAPRHPGMRVIYMSGYEGEVLAARGIDGAGMNFIQKPFSVQSLTNKIRNVLDQGGELTIDD